MVCAKYNHKEIAKHIRNIELIVVVARIKTTIMNSIMGCSLDLYSPLFRIASNKMIRIIIIPIVKCSGCIIAFLLLF